MYSSERKKERKKEREMIRMGEGEGRREREIGMKEDASH